MGSRIIFMRSPMGARLRSPMGAFKCLADLFLEIYTLPLYMEDGETYQITGDRFGASQLSGTLVVSNTPDGNDIAITQTVSVWSDANLTFTFNQSTLVDGPVWITVTNDDAEEGTVATQIAGLILNSPPFYTQYDHKPASSCGPASSTIFWSRRLSEGVSNIFEDTGYVSMAAFMAATPGFYLIQASSGKRLEFGAPSSSAWCSSPEGELTVSYSDILAIYYEDTGYQYEWQLIAYLYQYNIDHGGPPDKRYGWVAGDVAVAPKYPVSIGITSHVDGDLLFETAGATTLEAYAYDDIGTDISANIDWVSDLDGSLGSGASLAVELSAGEHEIYAEVTSAAGQYRRNTIIDLDVITIVVTPGAGDPAGGETVTVEGHGFTASTDVYFDNNLATNFTFISSTEIECDTPAADTGATLVDVKTITGAKTVIAENAFTYDPVDITSISPTTGPDGTAITITGTGFTANCTVWFGNAEADNIVFVDDTEITCDAPTKGPFEPSTVDVDMEDTVTGSYDTLVNAYTYT